jgi:hypothetical protein
VHAEVAVTRRRDGKGEVESRSVCVCVGGGGGGWVFGVRVAVIHLGGPTFIYVRDMMSMHTHRPAHHQPTYLIVRVK